MSNELNTSSNIHIYKAKRGTLALNIVSLFFFLIVMGIPLLAFILMIISFFRADQRLNTFAVIFGCFLVPITILLFFNIIQMTISVIMSFFSYIRISAEGIEQKNAPYKHIRANWADVDKLGKFMLFYEAIYLHTYEVLGFSLSLRLPFRLLRPKQGFISLTGYQGWPEGQLADDLKQYVPKLFENQPVSKEPQANNEAVPGIETPSVNQETRLLAAISHASVIFTNIGVLVPIGIYLTQKQKSSYLGFQALQALIWQIVMFVFTILASSCMVGSIFIPVLLATSSQNARGVELASGGIFVMMMASVVLLLFGNIAFVIYGIIGAVMTYQGKDFRYIFIGNRLQKRRSVDSINSA